MYDLEYVFVSHDGVTLDRFFAWFKVDSTRDFNTLQTTEPDTMPKDTDKVVHPKSRRAGHMHKAVVHSNKIEKQKGKNLKSY